MASSRSNDSGKSHVYRTSDPLRALLHDTLPDEIPIIMSNAGAHLCLSAYCLATRKDVESAANNNHHNNAREWVRSALAKLFLDKKDSFELPYVVETVTSVGKRRAISLPHIRSQWRYAIFMHKYGNKILYYCSRSEASLRAPKGIGRDKVPLDQAVVEAQSQNVNPQLGVDEDQAPRFENAARLWVDRFFTYRGIRRLHHFYDSREFLALEEKYEILRLLDVHSAFESIYTHSIAWATREKLHVKDSLSKWNYWKEKDEHRNPFGHVFDKVMQKSNWNETNGILVGPEVSRIFAEILFQQVDLDVKILADKELSPGQSGCSYKLFRYVDDYFIFGDSLDVVATVEHCLKVSLKRYNMRLNETKAATLERPFLSLHGLSAHEVGKEIDESMSTLEALSSSLDSDSDMSNVVRAYSKWSRGFIKALRVISKRPAGNVSLVVSRVPAALRERAFRLLDCGSDVSPKEIIVRSEEAWALVDICAYLVSLRPTESTAVCFCATFLVCIRLNNNVGGLPERIYAYEKIFCRSKSVLRAVGGKGYERSGGEIKKRQGVLIVCDIILCMSELEAPFLFEENELFEMLNLDGSTFEEDDYFKVLTLLFYANKANIELKSLAKIIENVCVKIECGGLKHAGICNMVLDLLSYPKLTEELRRKLVRSFADSVGVSKKFIKENEDLDLVGREFGEKWWFVDWRSDVSILQNVRRRTARQMY